MAFSEIIFIALLDPEGNVVKDIHNENPAFLKYKFSFNDVDSGKIFSYLLSV